MLIETSISRNYVPGWSAWEGVRELVQNGRDSEQEFSAPLDIRYRKESRTLVIENEGAILSHEALLLGHTTKLERSDLIGKFGEGLKLSCLALVRNGMKVKIRSGSEVWIPAIRRSEKFNAEVLAFQIQKGREFKKRVAVEVQGVSEESWTKFHDLFLFLAKLPPNKTAPGGYRGSVILDPLFAGRIYVKGIFVGNDKSLRYGYDLLEAEVDRDRKMVEKWSLASHVSSIWREALSRNPTLATRFTEILTDDAGDVQGVEQWNVSYIPAEAREAVVAAFVKTHGENALPVGNLAESTEIEHLGKTGVVVPKPLRAILESVLGTVETNKEKLRNEVVRLLSVKDLDDAELSNLQRAIRLFDARDMRIAPLLVWESALTYVDVAEFRDPNLLGLFKDERVYIARSVLASRSETLRVLVHEAAHAAGGGDGEKTHVANIERTWSAIVSTMG